MLDQFKAVHGHAVALCSLRVAEGQTSFGLPATAEEQIQHLVHGRHPRHVEAAAVEYRYIAALSAHGRVTREDASHGGRRPVRVDDHHLVSSRTVTEPADARQVPEDIRITRTSEH